jgi:serine/threonine protein kinase
LIIFIAVEYHRDNLFHGDIKPQNIFYFENQEFYITSDVGSLLDLGEPNKLEDSKFIVT